MPSATAKPSTQPDAVIFHDPIGGHMDPQFGHKLRTANDRYAPTLGASRIRVYAPNPVMPFHFGIPACEGDGQTINFPVEHPLSGQSRYLWFPAVADGKGGWTIDETPVGSPHDSAGRVMFGWLRPEAKADAS